jgi:hypothetical protein
MANETITLIEPTLSLSADFCTLAAEFMAEGDRRYHEVNADLKGFIQRCADEAVGLNLLSSRFRRGRFGWFATA